MDREKQISKILLILIILWILTILGIIIIMYVDFLNDDIFWDAIGDGNIFGKPE